MCKHISFVSLCLLLLCQSFRLNEYNLLLLLQPTSCLESLLKVANNDTHTHMQTHKHAYVNINTLMLDYVAIQYCSVNLHINIVH